MNTLTHEYKAPAATGNPWIANPEDQATVPVPLPIIIVSVEGPYTAQDRKLWAFLLHTVWEELGEKVIHEVPVREIENIFRQFRSRHHTDWIWESVDRLAGTKVKWIRVEGDRRYRGVDNLLGAETDEEAQRGRVLRFNFPPLLVPILKDPKRFARLRTHFMIELSGKYAVSLYQLLESAANKENPQLIASVEELRRWLKVPEGKMLRWQDFRRKVLEHGIRQINDSPEGAGFTVTYAPLKEGRAIKQVRFTIAKTAAREKMEYRIRAGERQLTLPLESGMDIDVGAEFSSPPEDAPPEHTSLLDKTNDSPDLVRLLTGAGLSPRDARKIAREQWAYVNADDCPAQMVEGSFESYLREKIDLLDRQYKAPRSRTGFLLKAIRENWTNPEFAAREKEKRELRAANERKQQRGRLEQERMKLSQAYSDACDGVYAAIMRDAPDALDTLIQAVLEETPILQQHCKGSTPEERYGNSIFIETAVHKLMERHYLERFQAVNNTYQPRLDALDAQINALG